MWTHIVTISTMVPLIAGIIGTAYSIHANREPETNNKKNNSKERNVRTDNTVDSTSQTDGGRDTYKEMIDKFKELNNGGPNFYSSVECGELFHELYSRVNILHCKIHLATLMQIVLTALILTCFGFALTKY